MIETVEKGSLTKAEITERITELDASVFAHYDVTYERITYRSSGLAGPYNFNRFAEN